MMSLSYACQPLVFENAGDPPKSDDSKPDPDTHPPETSNPDSPEPNVHTGTQAGDLEKDVGKFKVDVAGRVVVKNSNSSGTANKVSAKVSLKVKVNSKIRTSAGSAPVVDTMNPPSGGADSGDNGSDGSGSGGHVSDEVDRIEVVNKVRASVKFIQETAGFLNTFGWYKVDKDKKIHDVKIIWQNASEVGSQYGQGPLQAGDTLDLGELAEDVQLGFFIIANGFAENNWTQSNQSQYVDLQSGSLEFRDGASYQQSSPATLSSVSPALWFVPNHGVPFILESKTNEQVDYGFNAIYHTAAARENSLQLNPDAVDHIRHRVLDPGKRFSIEIEDLYYSAGANAQEFDGDYKDLVFELILSSLQIPQPTVKTFE